MHFRRSEPVDQMQVRRKTKRWGWRAMLIKVELGFLSKVGFDDIALIEWVESTRNRRRLPFHLSH